MRTIFGSHSATYWLLNSVCLRYAIAMASVWLRRSACNLYGFNDFVFDYPLVSSWFLCGYLSMVEVWYARLLSQPVPGSMRLRVLSECLVRDHDNLLNDAAFGLVRPQLLRLFRESGEPPSSVAGLHCLGLGSPWNSGG